MVSNIKWLTITKKKKKRTIERRTVDDLTKVWFGQLPQFKWYEMYLIYMCLSVIILFLINKSMIVFYEFLFKVLSFFSFQFQSERIQLLSQVRAFFNFVFTLFLKWIKKKILVCRSNSVEMKVRFFLYNFFFLK